MKVKELQSLLSKLDPNLEVICYSEDPNLQSDGLFFRILDIEAVDTTIAEITRLDNNTPTLKLGKSSTSKEIVTLVVTSEF